MTTIVKLTKAERKFISPAISFGWNIVFSASKSNHHWDGDKLMPVKVGVVCEKLIEKGLLEKLEYSKIIRKTKLAANYICKAMHCNKGRIEVYDEDSDDYTTKGDCPECDGIGVLEQPRPKAKQ